MSNNYYIHTATTARRIDSCAIETLHIPSLVLMEHAAWECARFIQDHIPKNDSVFVLAGPGNNGGDGLAIARLLQHSNQKVVCYCPKISSMSEDEKKQFEAIKALKIPYTHTVEKAISWMQSSDCIVDALFGNGLTRSIEGNYKKLVEACNASKSLVFSIDIPSGLDATFGHILGTAIKADYTISLDCYKIGQWICDGRDICGKLTCADIGIPSLLHENALDPILLLNEDCIRSIFPKRPTTGHKGTFGKGLMIGGSQCMHGAISMAANACYHSGIGTLTLMIPDCIADCIAYKYDFAMLWRMPSKNGIFDRSSAYFLKKKLQNFSQISIGNGMQKTSSTEALVECVLTSDLPVLVDADAIWAVGKHKEWLQRDACTILTPHIKEMSDLTGEEISTILEDPFHCVQSFCEQYPNCVLVLKSNQTYIGYQHKLFVYDHPNSALAKGGSGDVLCGILFGLLSQCHSPLEAALCAVYVHSLAADSKIDPAFFQPNHIIENLNFIFKKLRN